MTSIMKNLFIILLLFPPHALAWTKSDIALETTWQILNVIDTGQTLTIANECKRKRAIEKNLILGTCPTRPEVKNYFLTAAMLHLIIAHYLPKRWREPFQLVALTATTVSVSGNIVIGIKMDF